MEMYSDWANALQGVFTQLLDRITQSLPNILGALILLFVGWLLARLLRSVATKFTDIIDKIIQRYTHKSGIRKATLPLTSSQLIGGTVYWITILFFVTASTKVLDLDIFTDWLNSVLSYVPTLLAGALIILAGILVSGITRDVAIAAFPHKSRDQKVIVGQVVYIVILVTAIVIGADQIGIDITFLVVLLSVISAAFLGGLALTVSLGARTTMNNLISVHIFRNHHKLGERIRIGEHEGKIIEFTSTHVVLDTNEGVVSLPAKIMSENVVITLQDISNGN